MTESDYTAQSALSDVEATRRTLADRVVAPWWYAPTIGVPMGLMVGAIALDAPFPTVLLLTVLLLVAIAVAVSIFLRQRGVWVSFQQAGRRGRTVWIVTGVLTLIGVVVALQGMRQSLPVALGIALGIGVAVVYTVGGWLTDRAIRADLLERAGAR